MWQEGINYILYIIYLKIKFEQLDASFINIIWFNIINFDHHDYLNFQGHDRPSNGMD
jgi:hypothetical protein